MNIGGLLKEMIIALGLPLNVAIQHPWTDMHTKYPLSRHCQFFSLSMPRKTFSHCYYRGIFYLLQLDGIYVLYAYYIYLMLFSGSWHFLFKVLKLNLAIRIVLLHLSNVYFCFSLRSGIDFFEHKCQSFSFIKKPPFYPLEEPGGLDKWFE